MTEKLRVCPIPDFEHCNASRESRTEKKEQFMGLQISLLLFHPDQFHKTEDISRRL